MTPSLLAPALLLLLAAALQDRPSNGPAPAQAAVTRVAATVPTYANAACPIMGKPISSRLWTDTALGRIWVCCKSCIRDVQDDVEAAYRTAYPGTVELRNDLCPITGARIDERSPRLELQGLRFAVRDAEAVSAARASSQIVLARLKDPGLVDLGNDLCPVDGEPVAPNAFVVIDSRIVRLSSPRNVDAARKDPAGTLAKALVHARTQAKSK